MLIDISHIQVEEQKPSSYQAYNLYYLPIEYSNVRQTLHDLHIDLSHVCQVCQVREVGNAALVVANIWFVPTLEEIFGCTAKGLTGSGVSPEEFLAVAVQILTQGGHDFAKAWFWIGAEQYGLTERLVSSIDILNGVENMRELLENHLRLES